MTLEQVSDMNEVKTIWLFENKKRELESFLNNIVLSPSNPENYLYIKSKLRTIRHNESLLNKLRSILLRKKTYDINDTESVHYVLRYNIPGTETNSNAKKILDKYHKLILNLEQTNKSMAKYLKEIDWPLLNAETKLCALERLNQSAVDYEVHQKKLEIVEQINQSDCFKNALHITLEKVLGEKHEIELMDTFDSLYEKYLQHDMSQKDVNEMISYIVIQNEMLSFEWKSRMMGAFVRGYIKYEMDVLSTDYCQMCAFVTICPTLESQENILILIDALTEYMNRSVECFEKKLEEYLIEVIRNTPENLFEIIRECKKLLMDIFKISSKYLEGVLEKVAVFVENTIGKYDEVEVLCIYLYEWLVEVCVKYADKERYEQKLDKLRSKIVGVKIKEGF